MQKLPLKRLHGRLPSLREAEELVIVSAESTTAKPSRYIIVAQLKLSAIQALEQTVAQVGSASAVAETTWILASSYPPRRDPHLLRPVVRSADHLLIVDVAREKAIWTGYGVHKPDCACCGCRIAMEFVTPPPERSAPDQPPKLAALP